MTRPFSLLGGPFHRLACRTGLVRGSDTTRFGLILGVSLWLVLMAIAVLNGVGGQLFALSKVSGHARLLVVLPLFFFAESLVDPRVAGFVASLSERGVEPGSRQRLATILERVSRWNDSWAPDTLCLAIAVVIGLTAKHLPIVGATAGAHEGQAALSLAIFWFWVGCLALFRFLLARWLFRLGLWVYLLWRVSRLELHLVPTHPDGVGGLGGVELVQTHFVPLVMALSVLQSASLAEELAAGTASFGGIAPAVAFIVIADLVLFVGPTLLFFEQLWRCRVRGLNDYMGLGAEYVTSFERKWVRDTKREGLLGTPDLQSLADLNNSVAVVRTMRTMPASRRLFTVLGAAALLPMLPLLLFEYPLSALAARFLQRLTGL